MRFDEPATSGKTRLVLGLVVVGIGVLAVGAFVAVKKRPGDVGASSGDRPDAAEVGAWCAIRAEWASEVDPLVGDILLSSVKDDQKAQELNIRRNRLCQDYARRVRELRAASARIKDVEVALIREGKVRANIAIEIANAVSQLAATDVESLSKARKLLNDQIRRRIEEGKATADREVAAAMAAIPECRRIFRGPMTDEATPDNPYLTWDELDFGRQRASKQLEERARKLEPRHQWNNLVYHKLVSKHGGQLRQCYRAAKNRNRNISDSMGLRVRLKGTGEVARLGIEWMDVPDDKILDCLLKHAAKWKLPRPRRAGDYAVVTLDFEKM